MSYSLLPVYYSTTNTRKRKSKKKSKATIAADVKHAKFLKKMGISSRSSVGLEQRPSKPWVTGSSPVESTIAPLSNNIPTGQTPKRKILPHNFTIAPAYNKGAYQVITKSNVKDIGR